MKKSKKERVSERPKTTRHRRRRKNHHRRRPHTTKGEDALKPLDFQSPLSRITERSDLTSTRSNESLNNLNKASENADIDSPSNAPSIIWKPVSQSVSCSFSLLMPVSEKHTTSPSMLPPHILAVTPDGKSSYLAPHALSSVNATHFQDESPQNKSKSKQEHKVTKCQKFSRIFPTKPLYLFTFTGYLAWVSCVF